MKFWDREKEKEWLKKYLLSEPNSILFVYGPKSSGKSTLMYKVIDEISDHIIPYFYDLRLVPISGYKDVLRIFFREKGWKEKIKESIPSIAEGILKYFEIEAEALKEIFEMKINPFEVMENALRSKKRKTKKTPVIVFDELQKLKEVYMNSPNNQRGLINELFNFFVRLTKVLHLAHVIVMTSDTFFIERVYTDSTLKNCAEYYLIDFFDNETTRKILKEEDLKKEEVNYVIEYVGGVPWILERILSFSSSKEYIKILKNQFISRIYENIRGREDLKELIKRAIKGENLYYEDREIEKIKELVEREIFFYDPINRLVKFQTKLDEVAAKEVIERMNF